MIQGPFRIDVSDNKNPGRPKNVKVERKKGAKKAAIKDQEREKEGEIECEKDEFTNVVYSPRLADRRYS